MAETKLVVEQLKLSYEGLFNISELYALINSWFYDRNWDWYEKMNQEQITPTGKQIRIILEPYKNYSDYYRGMIQIKIHITDLKEVDVEMEGQNLRLGQGEIKMIINGYLRSDRKSKWVNQPFYWLLSIIADKYLFHQHFQKLERWIEMDIEDLHGKIKKYLNTYQHKFGV
ncbi:MAG: hypothetical protein ABH824_00215 [Nanoarchaeota archaeon]|nr:hypothetical protein [Nanoarchaeota archaeon]